MGFPINPHPHGFCRFLQPWDLRYWRGEGYLIEGLCNLLVRFYLVEEWCNLPLQEGDYSVEEKLRSC